MRTIRIGSGAGYAGDRLEPALELMEKGDLDYIGFECLAERTVALAQLAKIGDPARGYNDLLAYRMEQVMPLARKHGVKVITNMGAANPEAAVELCVDIARRCGLHGLKIASVTGDDMLALLPQYRQAQVWETGRPLGDLMERVVSANAYMGVAGIVEALAKGADIVITGRVADPALFLAPLVHEFGWKADDWERLGRGTAVGHLLECAGQVTGGYYAEPGKKDVPHLDRLGFPLAEVAEDGSFLITKVAGSGGVVDVHTCTEQLLYEIHDPQRYMTPDVVADFSGIRFTQAGENRVQVTGASGTERPSTLKVSVGYRDSFIGDGEISYGGPGCLERATLAGDIVARRLKLRDIPVEELKIDLLGIHSLFWGQGGEGPRPSEVRLRVSARTDDRTAAARVGEEVESLYTNGPAGGGGATKGIREMIAVASISVARNAVAPTVMMREVGL